MSGCSYFKKLEVDNGNFMIEVYKNLYCGNEQDFISILYTRKSEESEFVLHHNLPEDFAILHACKEPYHRAFVGYTGRGCPKDSPEYLWAERGNRLALNMVDAPKPEFFAKEMIDKALEFIEQKLSEGLKVFVHCNQGESRAPSICLLYLIKHSIIKGDTLEDCETEFLKIYPGYYPGTGIRGFMKEHWSGYIK